MRIILFLLLTLFLQNSNAQEVYQHTSKNSVYDFLEELAAQQIIDINTVVKPYSRKFIAQQLQIAAVASEKLNQRQQKELDFFLRDFNKELNRDSLSMEYNSAQFLSKKLLFSQSDKKRWDALFYENGTNQISVNPVLGGRYNVSAKEYQRWYGGEINMYGGQNWGMYVNFRDVAESSLMTNPRYLNQLPGGVTRGQVGNPQRDYSEVRGGITYSWKWGSIGLINDHFQWGNHQNGAIIFSGNQPALPHLRLQLKPAPWFEFNYIHAWLNSEVIDSTRSYTLATGAYREVYRNKFMTANLFTIKPVKYLNISIGNSTVYADLPLHPAYLLPFFFYRSVDHTLSGQSNSGGQNGQLFFDMSTRNIKFVHLYASMFIDEVKLGTIYDEAEQRNQLSYKIGGRISNLFKSNISLIAEYTRSNPYAYRHFIPATDFTSNNYNLGHYLKDNSQEIYLALIYKPIPRLYAKIYYLNASKGEILPFSAGAVGGVSGVLFQENIEFEHKEFGLKLQYEYINDVFISASIIQSDLEDITNQYSPSFQRGKNTFFNFGLSWGF